MKIHLSSAVGSADLTEVAASSLRTAGHSVCVDGQLTEDEHPDLLIALLSGDAEASTCLSLWEKARSTHDNGVPVMGVSTSAVSGLPAMMREMPHDGDWAVLDADDVGRQLAVALEQFRAESHTPSDQPATERGDRPRLLERGTTAPKKLMRLTRDVVARHDREENAEEDTGPRSCKVFVSYSTSDKLAVNVCNELRRVGYDVFFGGDSIPGSADWRATISQEIRQADKLVFLLSPNVLKRPRYPRDEVWLAQSVDTTIIPVRLRKTAELTEGFDLAFSGTQTIDLFPDFNAGMQSLFTALGGAYPENEARGLRDRLGRGKEVAVRFARQHELGSKSKKYGAAVAAGAGVVAVAAAKVMADQERTHARETSAIRERQARVDEERFDASVQDYVERTDRQLNMGLSAAHFAAGMSASDYREEGRPKFMKVLGGLGEIRPPTTELVERHKQLVEDLEKLVQEFDNAAAKADRGDADAYARSVAQLNEAWATLMTSSIRWFRVFVGDTPDVDTAPD